MQCPATHTPRPPSVSIIICAHIECGGLASSVGSRVLHMLYAMHACNSNEKGVARKRKSRAARHTGTEREREGRLRRTVSEPFFALCAVFPLCVSATACFLCSWRAAIGTRRRCVEQMCVFVYCRFVVLLVRQSIISEAYNYEAALNTCCRVFAPCNGQIIQYLLRICANTSDVL